LRSVLAAAFALALLLACPSRTVASPPSRSAAPRDATAMRVEAHEITGNGAEAVRLDGQLTESAWAAATPVSGFVQRDPKEGGEPTFQTEVRILYDRDYLYVGVWAMDADPSRIVGIRTRRDEDSPSDWIRVMVDSYCDRRTAYEFAVNPSGVRLDRYWFADSNTDTSWDAVWDVSVSRDARGWRAEFRIPFSQLRFEPGKRDTFGFAVLRQIGRLNETSSWPLIAKSKPGFVSQMGELGGLKLVGAAKRLEVLPYTVGQVKSQPVDAGDPFTSSPDRSAALGLDLKYALTPGLTLTTTINPDFGQVEADPAVVNLTAFETFYQERRPFFVEGSGNLQFDLDCSDGRCTGLFYSRRIGRRPHESPDAPDGGFVSTPATTTILGAAKLTGRVGSFAVGALNAVTSGEDARLSNGFDSWQQSVEPLTNYTVAQAKREWKNQSSLGFAFTNTTRRLDNTLVSVLPSNATTGGVNWDWRLKDPRFSITGYWAGSSVRGSAEAIDALQQNAVHYFQRPDAAYLGYDPTKTSLNGHAGSAGFRKIGGSKVRFSFVGGYKTPGFEVNDVGYERRADEIWQSAWAQVRWDTPTKHYRNIRLNLNQWSGWNFGGDSRYKGVNVNAHIVLPSNWSAGAGGNAESSGIDDRATRGGPAIRSKSGGNFWYYVESDSRKVVNGGFEGYVYRDQTANVTWGLSPTVKWRPTSFLSLTGGVQFDRSDDDAQWVENVETTDRTHYVFGRIHQTTVGLTARVNYTVTPTLSMQLYAQPFVSAGAYSSFREVVKPRAATFGEQFAPYAYDGTPDFNYRSFRMTNVLRWEYKPGSALYVVWQQMREDSVTTGAFRFRRDMDDLFGLPATNVLLVKFSYWLNL
jgi:hypothetical protein